MQNATTAVLDFGAAITGRFAYRWDGESVLGNDKLRCSLTSVGVTLILAFFLLLLISLLSIRRLLRWACLLLAWRLLRLI